MLTAPRQFRLAVLAAAFTAGCATASRANIKADPQAGDFMAACNGNAWVDVNNNANFAVDVYASYDVGDDVLLGTVQPGHARFGLTKTPVSSFFTRRPGNRTILEATSNRHPATDRVAYTPGCAAH